MGQFSVKLDAEGLNYTISNSWYSRIGSQSGFAPLEHISAIENATVRVMPIWGSFIVAFVAAVIVGLIFRPRDYYYSTGGEFIVGFIGFVIVFVLTFFWREDRVSIYVDGEDFVHFVAPPYQSNTLVQELKKQLAALRNPPS
jgi:hypothetical protein